MRHTDAVFDSDVLISAHCAIEWAAKLPYRRHRGADFDMTARASRGYSISAWWGRVSQEMIVSGLDTRRPRAAFGYSTGGASVAGAVALGA